MKYRNLVVNLTNTKKIKEVVGTYSNNYGNASVIKSFQFFTRYTKYAFNRTAVNSWKAKTPFSTRLEDQVFWMKI